MKYIAGVVILVGSYITSAQATIDDGGFGGGSLGGHSVIQAYACDDCNSSEARTIALREAPKNSCSIYRNGGNATYCESISKTILIPSNKSRETFKFIVTSSINSNNQPQTTIITFPISAKEHALMDEYFYLHDKVRSAVNQVSRDLSELAATPVRRYAPSYFSQNQRVNGNNDECKNHPTNFLSSSIVQRDTINNVGQRVASQLRGGAVDATHTRKLSGGGFSVSKDGFGASVSFQYVKKNNIAFIKTDDNNRLAFDVHVGTDPLNSGEIEISVSLNKLFTKIDGFQYPHLLGNGKINIENSTISSCLRDYIEKEGEEPDTELTSSGGSGSETNPFWGPIVEGLDGLSNFCAYRRKVHGCSTTREGVQTCTSSVITFTARCGSVPKAKN